MHAFFDQAATDPSPASRASAARYLPDHAEGGLWAIAARDAGSTIVGPRSPYPPAPQRHPAGYGIDWERGRTLQEYQIVYLSRGRGELETAGAGCLRVKAGEAFILFPGEWHRYRPASASGWHDHWLGFRGEYAGHLMRTFFDPAQPLLSIGDESGLVQCARNLYTLMSSQPAGYRGLAAAEILRAIALLRAAQHRHAAGPRELALNQARLHLLAHADGAVDLPALARSLGMSYSTFRRDFKHHTGDPPHRYSLKIRLNRARALLAESKRPVADIAAALGFSSPEYFSRIFKQAEGRSPSSYREHAAREASSQPSARRLPLKR